MGPLTLFDKSFLQMLSVDEAVIFDALFPSVIVPVYYAEVLADLAKEPKHGGPAERAVSALAGKTPIMHCYPTAYHAHVVASELNGQKVPMDGRPTRSGGRASRGRDGKTTIIYDEAPESVAFSRWQDQRFEDLERQFAARWRAQLAASDHAAAAKLIKSQLKILDDPKNLDDAFAIAQRVVNGDGQAFLALKTACELLLQLPNRDFRYVAEKWKAAGRPKLGDYAPYTAYCLLIDIFFYVAVDKKLISPDRPSNRIDIAYLYYLPFCLLFVSNDKLHLRTARLFMREDQQLVEGQALKDDLNRLAKHYAGLPKEELERGLMQIVRDPPAEGDYLATKLYAEAKRLRAGHGSRIGKTVEAEKARAVELEQKQQEQLLEQLKRIRAEAEAAPQIFGAYEKPDNMLIKRSLPMHRGGWRLLPESVAEGKKTS